MKEKGDELMKKYDVLKQIKEEKIVGIIRVDSVEKAEKTLDALYEGGLKVVELTFTIPYAHTILAALTQKYAGKMVIGAGTILDEATARIAILSGAEFLVTPTVNVEVIKLANRYGIPCLSGINTPTELVAALENGVDVVKLFPASNFKPGIIKDLKAPFPNAEIMPTGGVSLANIKEWIAAGAYACGVGGELVAGAKTGDYASIVKTAKAFKELVAE